MHTLLHSVALLALFGLLCVIAQKLFPSNRDQKAWRKDSTTDLVYWLVTNLLTVNAIGFFAALMITIIALIYPGILNAINSTAKTEVTFLGVLLSLILLDLSGYWVHRLTHTRRLWKFHSIHHSSREIDWLSSTRFHPLESILIMVVGFTLCVLCGFNLATIGLAVAIRGIYGYVVHANVTWDYGPLGYIIASPHFHRWHHSKGKELRDRNFAGVFSLWDFIFGTAYRPKGQHAKDFGVSSNIGSNFWQHFLYPFKTPTK